MTDRSRKVVFFDAGGTLFEVRGSVGELYDRIAREHGIAGDPTAIDLAFGAAVRAQGPLAFAGLQGAALEAAERAWWFQVVTAVFADRMGPTLLERYFDALYDYFRLAEAWRLFPDVRPALERLADAGFRLGIVSNFDSRLDQILAALEIERYFESVIVSSRAGVAKPDPAIFQTALVAFGLESRDAWHVGDTPHEDIAGAIAAGVRGILLDRGGRHRAWTHGVRVTSLDDLPAVLR